MRDRALAVLLAAALAGCTEAPGAHLTWVAGGELAKVKEAAGRTRIEAALDAAFGTPARPRAPAGHALDAAKADRGRQVYTGLCLHCHGDGGDGRGAAADALDPPARDFRRGLFKFSTTASGVKPRRQDLVTTVKRGIPMTKMPSFAAHDAADIDAAVEYVRWIASRGECEHRLALKQQADGELDDDTIKATLQDVAETWAQGEARESAVEPGPAPEPTPALVARGRELFLSDAVKCASCHGTLGKGDGPSARDLKDDWDNPIRPRDLTLGVFRNGQRPADLYRSISCGIKGTPMPSFGSALKPADIWALVHFVRSLGAVPAPVW